MMGGTFIVRMPLPNCRISMPVIRKPRLASGTVAMPVPQSAPGSLVPGAGPRHHPRVPRGRRPDGRKSQPRFTERRPWCRNSRSALFAVREIAAS